MSQIGRRECITMAHCPLTVIHITIRPQNTPALTSGAVGEAGTAKAAITPVQMGEEAAGRVGASKKGLGYIDDAVLALRGECVGKFVGRPWSHG